MKKFTRILALAMALVMLLSFTACSSDKAADDTTAAADAAGGDDAKTYVIYSDNAFAPFEFYDDETSAYVGVDMEILAAIAEDQGIKYEMHNEGFDAAMGAVQAGQADAMIAGMTINDTRKETFDFSEGYFEDGSILVASTADDKIQSADDLKGKTIAAKKGTTSTAYAESIAEEYGFTITYFEDSPTMYQAVVTGTAVACFEDFSVIGWAIKSNGVALRTIGEVVNPGYYGFAVKKGDNAELIEKFNKGLQNIKDNGKYEEILAKYGY